MLSTDHIYESFVARQKVLLEAFAQANPEFLRYHEGEPVSWVLELRCRGLVRSPGGEIAEADTFHVGVRFPPDYCRRWAPGVVTMLTPHVWCPNLLGPAMCLGRMRPAMPVTDIIMQVYEILTYHNFAPHDGLNPAACQWARHQKPGSFPLERRSIHIPTPAAA